jgi:hypothetical protein
MSQCRSCRAPIVWAETESGKRMPLDPEPDNESGGVVMMNGKAHVMKKPHSYEGMTKYRSHFSSCPDAGKWRKNGGGQ